MVGAIKTNSGATVTELEEDIREMRILKEKASRSNVGSYMDELLSDMEKTLEKTERERPKKIEAPETPEKTEKPEEAIQWEPITEYSEDLRGKRFVEVDFRLKGIEQLPAKNITVDFTKTSFDLKVMDYEGKNYRIAIRNLYEDIKPLSSTYYVRKNHIVLDLVKDDLNGNYWPTLKASVYRQPPDETLDANEKNKNAIKSLYDEGSDEVKRLIHEKITETRAGLTLEA